MRSVHQHDLHAGGGRDHRASSQCGPHVGQFHVHNLVHERGCDLRE
ncbi:hypothetical protein [Stomatohabitans albus]